MSLTRRHFPLGAAGAAAGLILPGYYRRALEFIDRSGQPLLETTGSPKIELVAVEADWGQLPFHLGVGHPGEGPPAITYAEFFQRYDIDWFETFGVDGEPEPDWDREVDWFDREFYFDTWLYRDDPQMKAYELLKGLDLGPDFGGPDAVGELRLEAGSTMVSSYWYVEAADKLSLSLLQKRLDDLGTGIVIRRA